MRNSETRKVISVEHRVTFVKLSSLKKNSS